jgi:hypothetical protein
MDNFRDIIKFLMKKVRQKDDELKTVISENEELKTLINKNKELKTLIPHNMYTIQGNKQNEWLDIEDWQFELINSNNIKHNLYYKSICKYGDNYYCYCYSNYKNPYYILINLNTNKKQKIIHKTLKSHENIEIIEKTKLKNINKILENTVFNNIDDTLNNNINKLDFIIQFVVQSQKKNEWIKPLNWQQSFFDYTLENYFEEINNDYFLQNNDELKKLLRINNNSITICEHNNIKYLCYHKDTEYLNILNLTNGENIIVGIKSLPIHNGFEDMDIEEIKKIINYIIKNMTKESSVTVAELTELLSTK